MPLPVLAIIPARGGSKSIPKKNIQLLGGIPLLVYSIRDALASRHITRVIVSTDDPEIAAIALAHGAETPFLRPAEFAQDFSVDYEFLRHAVEWLKENEQYEPDLIVHLRPTEPMRNPSVLDLAIETLRRNPEADSLRSVHVAKQTPYKMWTRQENGFLHPVAVPLPGVKECYNQPRQKLPLVYWQDGYVDVIRPHTIWDLCSSTGNKILAFETDGEGINIDYPDELAEAEKHLTQSRKSPKREIRPPS